MNRWSPVRGVVLIGSCLLGCQSDGGGGGAGDGAGGEGGSLGGPAEAPVLDEVAPMHMALHLGWTNTTADCDEIEGERKIDAGDFALFFSAPGSVDNRADNDATDTAVTYTYRLRCKKGDSYSDYSNEVSASPTDL